MKIDEYLNSEKAEVLLGNNPRTTTRKHISKFERHFKELNRVLTMFENQMKGKEKGDDIEVVPPTPAFLVFVKFMDSLKI